ncbi:MAG: imelysin family protein, partial [Salibacteraceae bacterium]
GPIDADDGPEGLLNAWPLDEGYIDYTQGGTDYSIVNDPVNYPDITKEVLEGLNEKNGEKNISVGYHAIEFLLWGQDDPDAGKRTAGERPFTDYITDGTASHQARRGTFLKLCADLLLDHLQLMLDAWNPKASDNYRATFLAMDNDEALRNIFTAMGTFSKSELAGERIFVALKNQDQEDEHSCFSDNTHRDIITNAQGIRNVFTGTYTQLDGNTVSGASVQDLIELVHGNMATEMNALSTQSIDAVNHIPVPFDLGLTNETIGGDGPIMKAVIALQSQGDKIAEVAKALGLTISTKLPE